MEKQTQEVVLSHDWLWQGDNTPPESATLSEVACFSCGVYSRTEQRLNAAIGGRDAINIPDEDDFTSDCFQFALCLPCE